MSLHRAATGDRSRSADFSPPKCFHSLLIIGWLCLAMCAGASEADLGPLYDEFKLTLEAGRRVEAIGPIFHYELQPPTAGWGIAPLFSTRDDPVADSREVDLLYPLLTYDRYGLEYRLQLLQWLSFSGGQNQAENRQRRFTLFPIYFQQRSIEPGLNYTAVFPIYGTLKERFFRDEIEFVLWPLYVKTRKKELVTYNAPYPLFHWRTGQALSGWQFWPLFGREEKGVTYRTNVLEELQRVGGHRKLFALWPLFFHNDLGLGTENPQRVRVFLPFYSLLRSPERDSSTVLWPFFTWTDDRARKYREFDLLGPLVVFADGEGKTTRRIWPFFSQARNPQLESRFYLWPVYKYNRARAAPLDRRRTRILFFLYSNVEERNVESGETRRRRDLWPLFTYRRDLEGRQRWQVLAPIEPCLPGNRGVERNYSPLWSIWRAEKNPGTGAASQSLLWNLYRRERTAETKKCSLLFGLIQYQSGPEGKRWRLLYIPLSRNSPVAPEAGRNLG